MKILGKVIFEKPKKYARVPFKKKLLGTYVKILKFGFLF